jgi:hypothetical protein
MADPTVAEAVAPPEQSIAGVAPPQLGGFSQQKGGSVRTAADLGWVPTPDLDRLNKELDSRFMQQTAPVASALAKATQPTATPADRIAAMDGVKSVVKNSADQARPEDVIRAVLSGNIGDIMIALTGGSDVKERALNGAGQEYRAVYNRRNEFRRFETQDGKVLTPEELDQIGPLTTRRDVTAERTAGFQVAGIPLRAIAESRANDLKKFQQASTLAAGSAVELENLSTQAQEKAKRLRPATVNPTVQALLRGASTIGSSDTQQTTEAVNRLIRLQGGSKTAKDIQNTEQANGGFHFGFRLEEGKGVVNKDGKIVSEDDIKEAAKNYSQNLSSTQRVESKKNDLLERAQILAAGKNQQLLDDLTGFININSKIAALQAPLEAAGGIHVAKPNLPYELTGSFFVAEEKAIADQAYAKKARLFAEFMSDRLSKLPKGASPDTAKMLIEFSNDPRIKEIDKAAYDAASRAEKESAGLKSEISQAPIPADLMSRSQPPLVSTVDTNPPTISAAPPKSPQDRSITKPAPAQTATEPKRKTLAEIKAELNKAKENK